MHVIWSIIGAVLGLAIGSFLNVVVYRVPAGLSLTHPPSRCPRCETPIAHRDNVPVLGWILLRGRCRSCSEPISVRYPLVEATTAAVFALTPWVVGDGWIVPAYWWFGAVTLALGLIDLDTKRLPNVLVAWGVVGTTVLLGVGGLIDGRLVDLVWGLGAGAVTFAFLLLLALAARGGFGFGDVKLGFLLGLASGFIAWEAAAVSLFAGFLIGGVVAVVFLILRRGGRKDAIPFGPSMIAGSWLAIAWGERIFEWYLG